MVEEKAGVEDGPLLLLLSSTKAVGAARQKRRLKLRRIHMKHFHLESFPLGKQEWPIQRGGQPNAGNFPETSIGGKTR